MACPITFGTACGGHSVLGIGMGYIYILVPTTKEEEVIPSNSFRLLKNKTRPRKKTRLSLFKCIRPGGVILCMVQCR